MIIKRKIKKITGKIYDADKKDSVTYCYQIFNQSGKLVEEAEPLQYCGRKMYYEGPKDRLIKKETFCGETTANGEYTYTYPNDTTVIQTFEGSSSSSTLKEVFNSAGRLLSSVRNDTIADNNGIPDIKLIILTMHDSEKYVLHMIEMGVHFHRRLGQQW